MFSEKDLEEIKKILDEDEWQSMKNYFIDCIKNNDIEHINVKKIRDGMLNKPEHINKFYYCASCNYYSKSAYNSNHIKSKMHKINIKVSASQVLDISDIV